MAKKYNATLQISQLFSMLEDYLDGCMEEEEAIKRLKDFKKKYAENQLVDCMLIQEPDEKHPEEKDIKINMHLVNLDNFTYTATKTK